MSVAEATAGTQAKQPTELFGKKERKIVKDPLWDNNPITLQVLGICSALAVTTSLKPTLVMCIALTAVLCGSNVIISIMRNFIPNKIRIIVMLSVISSLVILVDQLLKAFSYGMSKELSVFVSLIITNCIVMGRAEAFAMANKPWASFLDGLGNSLGYSIILIMVGFGRELLGSGKLLGFQVIPEALYQMGYVDVGLMITPPGAFILLGFIIWIQRTSSKHFED
ncbi:NADH:ubiquinone reductase (Na(+)-transporting) subunit D [Sulfidibacter corallicola]|uniref:Na(+)-translocating NADH-quinone reductase subunit D n=1 Tax=Sulfidibacter corallicola TaxID=2818388 RepID=A0A8A4TUH9_SULCO|nr:NADH:ubiquinone reductase (Na(+)-transporting) subunit D [Sulfidibacter corallicola]QTD53170.1 NADH:ubiquinone reductase (Na(+)-transporting) subunit D [Sulfidibacter corallicola]